MLTWIARSVLQRQTDKSSVLVAVKEWSRGRDVARNLVMMEHSLTMACANNVRFPVKPVSDQCRQTVCRAMNPSLTILESARTAQTAQGKYLKDIA